MTSAPIVRSVMRRLIVIGFGLLRRQPAPKRLEQAQCLTLKPVGLDALRLAKRASSAFILRQGHVVMLAASIRLGLERLDATVSHRPCAHGSPCSATRPSPLQSAAASSHPRAAAPSGCAHDAWVESSIAALFYRRTSALLHL